MVNLLELFLKLENFYFVIHMKTKTLFLGMCLLITSGITAQQRTSLQIGDDGWALWLDRDASWKNDSLYLPPADISKITVAEPTCGWDNLFSSLRPESEAREVVKNKTLSLKVRVPGTVEEYYWDALSNNKGLGNTGDYKGVSWWGTDFTVSREMKGKRIKIFFSEGIRQRAEVFVNRKLVGYELVHQTPFEIDVTDVVNYGSNNELAVRITDPSGNFSWGDYTGDKWGDYLFPQSHGFGGILGAVELRSVSPLYVSDVFVKNKPSLKDIDVDIEIINEASSKVLKGSVDVAIVEAWKGNAPVTDPKTLFTKNLGKVNVKTGETIKLTFSASVPEARLWELKNSNLYNVVTTIKDSKGKVVDQHKQRFGFRFLSVEGYGKNATLNFNGKRTLLISSISWGYWPTNGMYPTRELARKHIESAFILGQNMLNFHRCQGNTQVLDLADEMGMLYYEEPGGYSSSRVKEGSEQSKMKNRLLANQLNSQRFLRMVKRDRNHPSLLMYNMINEPGWIPDERAKKDMADAHLLDPTRLVTYGSGFMNVGNDEPRKLHMIPYDQTQRTTGYCDIHNAGNSAGVYVDAIYNSPESFLRNERAESEIFVWGEEAALASPPQLEKVVAAIEENGNRNGWDGADYKDWLNSYRSYIKNKGLEKYYPSITKLITSLGDIMYYEHGRFLENVRIADGADIYVFNGYEDMKNDNFSGAVDVFRNIKGTPELINHYAQPAFVAVKVREKIGHVGDTNLFDMFVVNEHAVPGGDYSIKAWVVTPKGDTDILYDGIVKVSGGDTFSDLVAAKIPVKLNKGIGYYKINAELSDMSGKKVASGYDDIFAVDWKSDKINGYGAVIGGGMELTNFLKDQKKANVVAYDESLGKLDYILVGSIDQGTAFNTISSFCFKAKDGKTMGLNLDYFRGKNFDMQVDRRISAAPIDFNVGSKLIPGYDILGDTKFSLRWEGYIVAPYSGETEFELSYDDGANLWFDGEQVVDNFRNGPKRVVTFKRNLVAGKSYPLKIEAYQDGGTWEFALKWKLPVKIQEPDMSALLKRVRDDGTKLMLIDNAESWMSKLRAVGAVPGYKVFHPSKAWVGSSFMVREHPFFNELPVNKGMNWEYQRLVVYDGPKHFGLYEMQGEEPVVSLVGSPFHQITTSVGVLPYGKGKIVFSSLDLLPNLSLDSKPANVPKKILCNYLKWATDVPMTETYFK